MEPLIKFILIFLDIYLLAILAWVIFSWFRIGYDHPLAPVHRFLSSIVEPYMKLFRGLIKPIQAGGVALDLSAIIGIIVLIVLQRVLMELAAGQL